MRSVTRRRGAAFAAAVLAIGGLAAVPGALAAVDTPYDIEGTVPDPGTIEFTDGFGSTQELGPANSSATKLGLIHTAPTPMLATTNPNAQVDLRRVWLDTDKQDGKSWLYIGWERDSSNGSGVIMYEFMKSKAPAACEYDPATGDLTNSSTCNPWANRAAGDFILVWDQQGQDTDIILRTWELVNGQLKLTAGTELTEAPGNTNGELAQATLSADKFRGEAAVNLTDTVFGSTITNCLTFANVIPGTVTGNSDTADYKDTVLKDVSGQLTISNCGSVRVTKKTVPAGEPGSFGYTLDRTGGDAIRFDDSNPATDETKAEGTLAVSAAVPQPSQLQIDLKPGTNYRLVESSATPAGAFALDSIVCTSGANSYTVTEGGTFPVVEGATTDCVITNSLQPGTLIVQKVVVNDNGGTKVFQDFSFQVNGGTPVSFNNTGSNSLTLARGSYSVVEPAVTGYDTTYANSANGNANCSNLLVPAGGSVTCTVTNNDQPGTLIVQKVVVNDNGGTKVAKDFSFQVNGGTAVDFLTPDPTTPLLGQNSLTVSAGKYSVVEPAVTGYATTYANSANADPNCSDIVVGNGETKTCTITNNDTKAQPSGTTTMSWVLNDSLTISGLRTAAPDAATASVTFRLYSDAQCTTLVGSEQDSTVVAGAASTATGISVSAAGTYYWRAQYSGDSFNEGFTTACGSEVSTIGATYAQ